MKKPSIYLVYLLDYADQVLKTTPVISYQNLDESWYIEPGNYYYLKNHGILNDDILEDTSRVIIKKVSTSIIADDETSFNLLHSILELIK